MPERLKAILDKITAWWKKILKLYKSGKSNVEIAKLLSLGTGEVKLIIDLYKEGK